MPRTPLFKDEPGRPATSTETEDGQDEREASRLRLKEEMEKQRIKIFTMEFPFIKRMAEKACIGGVSRVRGTQDRKKELGMDQFIGQAGAYAFLKYWTGRPFSYEYMVSRYHANLHPHEGDDGSDLPAANLDIKTSYMRGSDDPMAYRLLVRPAELKQNWIYVLALVRKNEIPFSEWTEVVVDLVGWASSEMFPSEVEKGGPFSGAYLLIAADLKPLMPLRYRWK